MTQSVDPRAQRVEVNSTEGYFQAMRPNQGTTSIFQASLGIAMNQWFL